MNSHRLYIVNPQYRFFHLLQHHRNPSNVSQHLLFKQMNLLWYLFISLQNDCAFWSFGIFSGAWKMIAVWKGYSVTVRTITIHIVNNERFSRCIDKLDHWTDNSRETYQTHVAAIWHFHKNYDLNEWYVAANWHSYKNYYLLPLFWMICCSKLTFLEEL